MALVEKILTDGCHTGEPFETGVHQLIGVKVEVAKRSKLHTFAVIPRRWVEKDRLLGWKSTVALWKNRERLILSSIGMMQLAFIRILVRRS